MHSKEVFHPISLLECNYAENFMLLTCFKARGGTGEGGFACDQLIWLK